jgi:uncharacterized delta-60 repeat protein
MKCPFLVIALLFAALGMHAQGVPLDPSFDTDGKLRTNTGSYIADAAYAVTGQAGGKITVAGYSSILGQGTGYLSMIRYNANGSLDSSFGTNGIAMLYDGGISGDFTTARGLAIQTLSPTAGEKILVTGYRSENSALGYNFFLILARYNNNGTLDPAFGQNGVVKIPGAGNGILQQTDHKIVVWGTDTKTNSFGLFRFDSNGIVDTTFGFHGYASYPDTPFYDMETSAALQSDGKIVCGATLDYFDTSLSSNFGLVRYDSLGRVDTSFGNNGISITQLDSSGSELFSVAVQSDDKIVAVGTSDTGTGKHSAIVRYTKDGIVDSSFAQNGIFRLNFGNNQSWARKVFIQADGKIIVAGYAAPASNASYAFAIARLLPNGSLDTTFGVGGKDTSVIGSWATAWDATQLPNGNYVLVGKTFSLNDTAMRLEDFAVMVYRRFIEAGVLDFQDDIAQTVFPNPVKNSAFLTYELKRQEVLNIYLKDITGRVVCQFQKAIPRGIGQHRETLNFPESLPDGIYILVIDNGSGSTTVKLLKQ